MARVAWPQRVIDQLEQIIAYNNQFNPVAADKLGRRLFDIGESLAVLSHRGRPVEYGVRELVTVRPYILRYIIAGDVVVILSIRHSARRPLNPCQ